MGLAAKNMKKTLPHDTAIDATVQLNKEDTTGLALVVQFDITGSGDKDELRQIVQAAHNICPYSKAVKGNVDVKLNVK
jgi:osmotically inducible protein OsmC